MIKIGLAALLLALPAVASAHRGTYIAIQGGASWLNTADNTASGIDIQSDYKTGYGGALRVGNQFARRWRVEWELAYATNNVNDLTIHSAYGYTNIGYQLGASGREDAFSGMLNVLYDFTPDQPYHPFIGAGIGLSHITMHDVSSQGVLLVNDSATAFAYQGIAGIEMDISPQTAVYVSYHYFAAANPRFTLTDGEQFDSGYKSNNAEIGLRYFFR